VQGDAGVDDEVFASAGLDRARALVVTIEEPDRVVAITLMARAINPNLAIAATVPNRARGALLKRAGATQIIVADDIVASALVGSLAPALCRSPEHNEVCACRRRRRSQIQELCSKRHAPPAHGTREADTCPS